MAIVFADVQNLLDAILAKSTWAQGAHPPLHPQPHGAFWRQTGDYDQDYSLFTTGEVPNVGIPIMNTSVGQGLQSNFYVILTNPNGLADDGIPQMPGGPGGPYLTDSGYEADVAGTTMTGQQIQEALASWLTNGFPK
ncbi:hypothetical protein SAMN05444166_8353 [Singulisphaera sp. GP187]|uniref:hypothetical protein n=1 Tax=Singulisphaera sp. GP187 TaxID=1882752 RepID=UPI00092843F0|nr:hypothetical protein [Singulisphaera sp. GP187]SIO67393.1 hypothetical protein SAMN05444166_8353 [Singulisphaera sp. GP187]